MVGFFMCLNITLVCGKSRNPGQDIADMKELEKYLRTAEITEVEIDEIEGRTAPWGVMLNDGEISRQGIFKYIDRPRPTLLPDSYHYEIAAYKVSKLLKYPVVPPVVEREVRGTMGSLQLLLVECFSLSRQERRGLQPIEPQKFSDSLSELAVFESLIFCERESEDVYIQESDWKVCRVDFSEAFAPEVTLLTGIQITKCSKTLFHNLQRLEASDIKVALQSLLNDEEVDALLKRKDLIIDKINSLIQEKGEDAILF